MMHLTAALLRSGARMLRIKSFALVLLATGMFACLDEIDLRQADDLEEGIVVRGQLIADADTTYVTVNLERLFQFTSNLPDRVVTAQVVLENTLGESLLLPYREGAYRLPVGGVNGRMTVRPGIGYRLLMDLEGDESYVTDFDTLPPAVVPEKLAHELVEVEGLSPAGTPATIPSIRYALTTPVRYPDGRPARLLYQFDTDFAVTDGRDIQGKTSPTSKTCYVRQRRAGNDVILLNGAAVNAPRVENRALLTLPVNGLYAEANYVTAYQLAISPPAFTYFSQIGQIANQNESIFGNPPGPVAGNVSDPDGRTANVFGFFYAANRRPARAGVTPGEAGNPNFYCPLPPSQSPFPPPTACDDCLLFDNSSLTPPAFWEF